VFFFPPRGAPRGAVISPERKNTPFSAKNRPEVEKLVLKTKTEVPAVVFACLAQELGLIHFS
jgi:hypothetical protein